MEIKRDPSVRKFVARVCVFTYCAIVVGLFGAMCFEIIEPAVFLGVFAGFAMLGGQVVTWYFERKDRQQKEA